jgi:8-oxo-dGTP pyrophosphatase MutT (NUDIX family)
MRMIVFDDELRAVVHGNLTAHPTQTAAKGDHRAAAVAIVLVDSEPAEHDDDPLSAQDIDLSMLPAVPLDAAGELLDGRMVGVAGGAALLLCRRASRMKRHAGQWALPGGRIDPGEAPLATALRELDEELGVKLSEDDLVGWLDDYVTRSGYRITPVVLWGGACPDVRPAPAEVAAVYRIGLHALRDCVPRFLSIPESERLVLQLPLGNDLIHAPTAAVLYQFRQVALLGRLGERVDEIGEPVFAWS